MTLEQTLRQIKRAYFWRERLIVFFLTSSLFLGLINWFYLFFSLKKKTAILPLHLSLLFGVDRIGPKNFVFELPAIGLAIFVLNFILAYIFYERGEKYVSHLFLGASCFFQVVLLIGIILILKL
jgi:hypothetical protein